MGKIPSLDGLRAVSILLVVFGHAANTLPSLPPWLAPALAPLTHASLGVSIFFVISGYLITTLLLREQERAGRIQLRNFYMRRILRIFPAFYFYLLILTALAAAGGLSIAKESLAAAATFTWNYARVPESWWLGHFWSLCIEEQFYLLWPSLLAFAGAGSARRFAWIVLLLSPAIRVGSYFLFPEQRPYLTIMLHTRADALIFGCVAALLAKDEAFGSFLRSCFSKKLHWLAAAYLFCVTPFLEARFRGSYLLPIGYTLEGASITLFMLWLIENPGQGVGRILNWKPVARLGILSYSLYLWQQLFLTPENTTFLGIFPLNLVFAWLMAEISHRWVEKPMLLLKERFESR